MLSEVGHVNVGQLACLLRQQHLPTMPGRCDARSLVHVLPDVALLGHVRRARMDAHAHPDWARGQPLQRIGGRLDRTRRRRKGDKEGIPLRIDLDASVGAEGLAQDAAMLGERLRVTNAAQLAQ